MNSADNFAAALALVAMASPLQVHAKQARQTMQAAQAIEVQRLNVSPPVMLSRTTAARSDLAAAPFSFRLKDGAATIKSRSMSHDWQNGSLTLNVMRARSPRRADDLASFNFNRYSVMAADIGLVEEINGRDSLSFGLSYALENRRPSINIAAHNVYRTANTAATLSWAHDAHFRLSASLFSTAPIKVRSLPERLVELAGGAPLAARGASLTASFSPDHGLADLAYGVDLRRQRLSQSDAVLIGSASGRSDMRIGLFLKKSF